MGDGEVLKGDVVMSTGLYHYSEPLMSFDKSRDSFFRDIDCAESDVMQFCIHSAIII